MLTAKNLKGNWATLLLPINSDETIDYGRLSDEIDTIISFSVDGIYSNGTAGEFHNQTEKEFDAVSELLAGKCQAAGMKFQIGTSHPSPVISLERVKRCVALRPDAIQIILPDWVSPNEKEQLTFLKKIAEIANDIPLVLYNPPHAKKVLHPRDFAVFEKEVPQLIGVKVLSGDEAWVQNMKEFAEHLSIFVPGHMLATGVKNGIASGAYSNVACIHPGFAQQWWEGMQSDIESALEIEGKIQAFFKEVVAPLQARQYSNPALDKFLAAVGGWGNVGTRLRWPYEWISETEVAAAQAICKHHLPEIYSL